MTTPEPTPTPEPTADSVAELAAAREELAKVKHERDQLSATQQRMAENIRRANAADQQFGQRLATLWQTGQLPPAPQAAPEPTHTDELDLTDPAQLQAYIAEQVQLGIAQGTADIRGKVTSNEFNTQYLKLQQTYGKDAAAAALPAIQQLAAENNITDIGAVPGGMDALFKLATYDTAQQQAVQNHIQSEQERLSQATDAQGLAGVNPQGQLPSFEDIKKDQGVTAAIEAIMHQEGIKTR